MHICWIDNAMKYAHKDLVIILQGHVLINVHKVKIHLQTLKPHFVLQFVLLDITQIMIHAHV